MSHPDAAPAPAPAGQANATPATAATLKRGQPWTVTVADLDLAGRGRAFIAGHSVAIDDALPDETVRLEIIQTPRAHPQPRLARARVLARLASPFPARQPTAARPDHDSTDPALLPCPGAPWLPVPLPTQLAFKQQIARLTLDLARAATDPALIDSHLPLAALEPIRPSPLATGYRNKAEFTCGFGRIERIPDPRHPGEPDLRRPGQLRTIPEGFDPAVGFHRPGDWQTVHGFDHCPILPPFMHAIRRRLDRLCRSDTAVDNYRPWCDKGCRRTVMLRGGPGFDRQQLLFTLKTGGDTFLRDRALAELHDTLADLPDLSLHWMAVEEGSHPRGSEPIHDLHGEPFITARFGGLALRVRPGSFFQTNLPAAELLVDRLRQALAAEPPATLLDLYCGVGTLGLAAAHNQAHPPRIIGVESVAAAVADARENAHRNSCADAEYTLAPAEKSLHELFAGDLAAHLGTAFALIDPPRAGLHPKALKAILRSPLTRLAYVACNPASLAHDLPLLAAAGFRLQSLTPFDFFPHTPHLELLALLRRPPA